MDPMMILMVMISTVDKMAGLDKPLGLAKQDMLNDVARNGEGSPADKHFMALMEALTEFTQAAKVAREKIQAANDAADTDQGNVIPFSTRGGSDKPVGKHGPGCIC